MSLWNFTFKMFRVWQTLDLLRTTDPLKKCLVSHTVCLRHILLTLRLRTKNRAPQFPAHIFKAKQSIDSYENVCELFICKTYKPCTVSQGLLLRSLKWKRNIGEFISLRQVISWTFAFGHAAADHSFGIMLSDPEGQKTASPQGQTAEYIFSVSHGWKTSRGQLIQDPGDIPPDLEPATEHPWGLHC